ncbi:MAG TPA: hypothetical protein VFW86_00810 [Candidatus Limnocylindrales bacterium]|nr:hypothetical protein [Candidatus Limnocylindrales bacterium]
MFDLYQAPYQATYRQEQLYDEIAADRLARSGHETGPSTIDDRVSTARRVTLSVSGALSAIGAAFRPAGRRPHRI